ncbi:MAG: shikimate dehydrogenase [Streptosporangiaceae bacterium]
MHRQALRRAAVLGSPIAHSLSPALHRAAYAALGLYWRYDAIECGDHGLAGFLDGLDASWAGLSLTMPLKRAVLPLADEVSELAACVGGANTVVLDGGRRRVDNTDVGGMVDALGEAGLRSVGNAVVLGAGATASSALATLRSLGCREMAVVARDPARITGLRAAAERLHVDVAFRTFSGLAGLLPTDLLISTMPAGAADPVAPLAAEGASAVLDVVYDPWPTPLAVAAREAGRPLAGGFAMLLHQAARQVELMTGLRPAPVEAMRQAGERVLAGRASSS